MSAVRSISDDPTPRAVWWIWLAFMHHKRGGRSHIYGCASTTEKSAGFLQSRTVSLPSSSRLEIAQFTVGTDRANLVLDLLEKGQIDLTSLEGNAPRASVLAVCDIMSNVLGNHATRVRSYIGDDSPKEILPELIDIPLVLSELNAELNFDFRGAFANHIGGFDIVKGRSWPEKEDPFIVGAVNPTASEPDHAIVIARRDGADCALRAHIVASNASNEVFFNRLITLPPGVPEHRLTTAQSVYGLKASFFGESEEILYEVDLQFMRSIQWVANLVTSSLQIEDKLSRRAQGKGPDRVAKASGAARLVRQKSLVTADPSPSADRLHAMTTYLASALDSASRDRWFAKTFDDELGVIAYFDRLLGDPDIGAAVFVDPFINSEAIMRLLRLSCTDLTLTVLMSWSGTNADTGIPQDEDETLADLGALRETLDQAGPLMGPAIRVRNLVDKRGRQAFHDRYLMTRSRTGERAVYLLSNSLNAMAKNWPFCLSALSGPATSAAAEYIQGLEDGRDLAREEALRTTFTWPDQISSPS